MYGSVPLVMSQDTHLSVRIDKVPPGWTGKKSVQGVRMAKVLKLGSSVAQVGVPVISEKFDSN